MYCITLPIISIMVIAEWYIISPTATKTLICGILILTGGCIGLALGAASIPFVILGGIIYIIYLLTKYSCRCDKSSYSDNDSTTPIDIVIPPSFIDSTPISTCTPPPLDKNTIIFETTKDYKELI